VSIPRVPGATFDERRNTSRVFPVDPGANAACTAASRAWARAAPQHYAWIKAGAPPIATQEDHVRWFGVEYASKPRRVA
jgi:hypothetical protein